MKPPGDFIRIETEQLSVPSTRAYAMKPDVYKHRSKYSTTFSTLNSGLRDETRPVRQGNTREALAFQYPQLGPTR